jgi:hypothetical protein
MCIYYLSKNSNYALEIIKEIDEEKIYELKKVDSKSYN